MDPWMVLISTLRNKVSQIWVAKFTRPRTLINSLALTSKPVPVALGILTSPQDAGQLVSIQSGRYHNTVQFTDLTL